MTVVPFPGWLPDLAAEENISARIEEFDRIRDAFDRAANDYQWAAAEYRQAKKELERAQKRWLAANLRITRGG